MRRLVFDPKVRSRAAEWVPVAAIMLVSLLSLLLALLIPTYAVMPLTWGSLALALVMMPIMYWVESIPWVVACAVISLGAGLFYAMLMALSHQFGAMFAGILAIGLVTAFMASRKRLRMRQQRSNE